MKVIETERKIKNVFGVFGEVGYVWSELANQFIKHGVSLGDIVEIKFQDGKRTVKLANELDEDGDIVITVE